MTASKKARVAIDRKSLDKRFKLLGVHIGTAAARLRKNIMFSLVVKTGQDICYRCGERIDNPDELSIEHKDSWMSASDPLKAFFDLDNISFSHNACNSAAGRKPNKKWGSERERWAARNKTEEGVARILRWRLKRSEERRLRREEKTVP